MSLPILSAVSYVDPWGPLAPLENTTGVNVYTNAAPTDMLPAAQLVEGGSVVIATAIGSGNQSVVLVPPAPLPSGRSYVVQVQFVQDDTQPGDVDWAGGADDPPFVSAAVVTSAVRPTGGTISAAGAAIVWETDDGVPGAYVRFFDETKNAWGSITVSGITTNAAIGPQAGRSGSLSFPWGADTYTAYLRAAQPLGSGGFGGPCAYGPAWGPVAVPTAGPAISGVACDGEAVAVTWSPVTLPSDVTVGDTEYTLHLLSASNAELARAGAGGSGARMPLRADAADTLLVAGSVRFDALTGPLGTAQQIITAAPAVDAIKLTPSETAGNTVVGAVVAEPANLAAGTAASVDLLVDGAVQWTQTSSASPPQVSLDAPLPAGHRYELRAHFAAAGPPQLTGPYGPLAPVLAPAPALASAAYDGARLTLVWANGPATGVVGHSVTLTPATGNAITFESGSDQMVEIDVELDLSTTWTATVQPFGTASLGLESAAAAISLPAVTAPTVRSVVYDGETLTVEWDSATLPFLSGYTVALGSIGSFAVGPETRFSLPVSSSAVEGTSVTVTGTSATRSTAASAAVEAVAVAPAITGVSVGGTVDVTWTVTDPPAGATYVAHLLDGDTVVVRASGTATGATFETVPATPGLYSVRGYVELAASRGPAGTAAAILPQAPAILFGAILDDVLTLQWSPGAAAGATGYAVTYGATNGTTHTVETPATQLVAPLLGATLAPGGVSVTATAPNSASPAATASIVAGYAVQSGTYDGSTLAVTLSGSPSPAPATVWIDVLVDGRVAARIANAGAPSGAISVPVALTPGTPASVRATGVGAGPLTPPSAQVAIPTSAPSGVSAEYDGTNLHVGWEPVGDAGVTGYQVSVAGTSQPVQPTYVAGAGAASTTIAAQFTLPLSGAAAVTVSAVNQVSTGNLVVGPASAAAAPSLSKHEYSVGLPAAGQPPYVYRHGTYQTLQAVSGADVSTYVPNPFAQGEPSVAHDSVNTYFAIAPAGPDLPYQLTIDKSIWASFGQYAVRTDVRAAYRDFLKTVEALGVLPWAIPKLRQLIYEMMPQTFAETLYYRYGAWRDASLRAIDLEPGLRLRVSGALWQVVTATSPNQANGYVAAGEETYDLATVVPPDGAGTGIDPTSRALSVDAFLSLMLPGASIASSNVAAGPLDFFRNNRQTYYRLFYPASFKSSGSAPLGGIGDIADNVAIVGVPNWQTLENVTDQFATNSFSLPNSNVFATYFRGRDAVTPLLAAAVGGEQRWLPVGTTVRQALMSSGLAIWPGGGAGAAVAVARAVSSVVDDAYGDPVLRYEAVDMDSSTIAPSSPPLWPLDVPVLGGDEISAPAAVAGA